MENTYYKPGTWSAICDRCGVKFKSDQLRKTWDGFLVCKADYETRHVADFIKAPKPIPALPWTRPEVTTDTYCGPTYIDESIGAQDTYNPGYDFPDEWDLSPFCNVSTVTAIPGRSGPGCMVPGYHKFYV